MKSTFVSGAAIAATAVALVLSGAVPAAAGDKSNAPKTADKPPTEKMSCGGKNGCNAAMMGKGADQSAGKPAESDSKAASGDHSSGGQK